MRLTPSETTPTGNSWIYEAKYDGFRCLLQWERAKPILYSRTGRVLNEQFPEIIEFCIQYEQKVEPYLPLLLDGELVFFTHPLVSDFTIVQTRGRLRHQSSIATYSSRFPCHFLAFDLLLGKGENVAKQALSKRKEQLHNIFSKVNLPLQPNIKSEKKVQCIFHTQDSKSLWEEIVAYNGEGMIAKHLTSKWEKGIRTTQWVKIKHWRLVTVVLSSYDRGNGYFKGAIFNGSEWIDIVDFKHGLSKEQEATLVSFFRDHGQKQAAEQWTIDPAVCLNIACIDFDGKHLREPMFYEFQLDQDPQSCTWKQMQRQLFPIPESIAITHPDKPIWPNLEMDKDRYILYLQKIAPFLLPFLENRCLTLIRYPHGVDGESFYQKQCPDYAPSFIKTKQEEGIDYIVCQDIQTLLWLGNQLALEFHIPFQPFDSIKPSEIVFDLDPPSENEFSLAVEAALQMKELFDRFGLYSYVKTSGGKGLQLYLPLPDDTFTYEETRLFTHFIATYLCERYPEQFTTERLKKKRYNRLYIDYIQHDLGKTLIAPFSPRGNQNGLVSTPLWWEEVNHDLTPYRFTIDSVIKRMESGNPFVDFFAVKEKQPFREVVDELTRHLKKGK